MRPKIIYPSANDRWSEKDKSDNEDALASRHSNDAREQHQGKQNGYDKVAAFDFLDKGRKGKKKGERN